jgi:hypothetical protein
MGVAARTQPSEDRPSLGSDDLGMRFRIRVARVQSVEQMVSATDEQAAISKVEAELQKPYGLLGAWTTVDTQIEVVGTEPVARISSARVEEGPVLLSVAAAWHLALSRGTLYELINRGDRTRADRASDPDRT